MSSNAYANGTYISCRTKGGRSRVLWLHHFLQKSARFSLMYAQVLACMCMREGMKYIICIHAEMKASVIDI